MKKRQVSNEVLIFVLLFILVAIASLLLASCPVDQPLIIPPEPRAETFGSSTNRIAGVPFHRRPGGGGSHMHALEDGLELMPSKK